MGTSIQEQVVIQQVISCREYSWFNKSGDRWNRTQVIRQDVNNYNIIMAINRKSNVNPIKAYSTKHTTDI